MEDEVEPGCKLCLFDLQGNVFNIIMCDMSRPPELIRFQFEMVRKYELFKANDEVLHCTRARVLGACLLTCIAAASAS